MSLFSTDTRCRWGVGALFYRVNDFYFWPGTEQRSVVLEQSTFAQSKSPVIFKDFRGLEKIFSAKQKNIFTKAKIQFGHTQTAVLPHRYPSTYMPVLEYLRLSTAIRVCQYWTLARLDFPIAWCKIVRTDIVFAYDNPGVICYDLPDS